MKKSLYLIAISCSLASMLFVASCRKDDLTTPDNQKSVDLSENNTNPDETIVNQENERFRFNGYLYTQGNELGTNMIHIYRQHNNGNLTYSGSVASGGAGNGAALGSQGALALSDNHRWLIAVNAGDNSISSFAVHNDGSLTLVDTDGSGGNLPVSVCIRNRVVYVVNSGSDDIFGYTLDPTGNLSPIPGSNLSLSGTGVGPAQIGFSPNGRFLYVTEKMTNMITSFEVDGTGLATPGTSIPSTGDTPFGFTPARNSVLFVTNAEGSCTAYQGVNSGNLVSANGAVNNNQLATCWVALTDHERYAFVTNTGSDNISTYYISPWGSIYLVHAVAASTGDNPIDICVAGNNYYVYNINSISQTITGFRRGFLGDLISNGSTPGIPASAAGLVAW